MVNQYVFQNPDFKEKSFSVTIEKKPEKSTTDINIKSQQIQATGRPWTTLTYVQVFKLPVMGKIIVQHPTNVRSLCRCAALICSISLLYQHFWMYHLQNTLSLIKIQSRASISWVWSEKDRVGRSQTMWQLCSAVPFWYGVLYILGQDPKISIRSLVLATLVQVVKNWMANVYL